MVVPTARSQPPEGTSDALLEQHLWPCRREFSLVVVFLLSDPCGYHL